jgi:hypothetical protein
MRAHPLMIAGVAAALAACSSDDYVIVTINARPAVRDANKLVVLLANSDSTRMDTLSLGDQTFPTTFSVTGPGRRGDLVISVDALDAAGLLVGRGSATTTLAAPTAELLLDSADFVVNTDYVGDQFPASDFEAVGFQVAAAPDGTWTTAYRDGCTGTACNIFGRRFDPTGKPVQSALAASSNGFALSSMPTTQQGIPAVAATSATSLAVWDYADPAGSTFGVGCRGLDASGNATQPQSLVLGTDTADVVSTAALPGGNFVVAWNAPLAGDGFIRTAIVKPDCSLASTIQSVSTSLGVLAHRGSVAVSGDRIAYVWIGDGTLRTRILTSAAAVVTADTALVAKTATEEVLFARVAAGPGGGFVVAIRWALTTFGPGPGRIELLRLDADGNLLGAPALVTSKSSSDSADREGFGLASRLDGTVLVAWHTCGALGDGNLCGVFGRILRASGEPVSDEFGLATSTLGDQRGPAIAALPAGFVAVWTDASGAAPDSSGLAVRARIIYPPN